MTNTSNTASADEYAQSEGYVLPSGNKIANHRYHASPDAPKWLTGGTTEITADGGHTGSTSTIRWQSGPIEDGKPNGVVLEDVIQACIDRLRAFNNAPSRCRENSLAVTKLEEALLWLNERTRRRVAMDLEGRYAETGGLVGAP